MVHKYRLGDNNFVLDVNSSCVYIVDDLAYKLLDCVDENTKEFPFEIIKEFPGVLEEKLRECYDQLYELKISNRLFSKSNDKIFKYVSENLPLKSLCLNVAHDCNLRCEYCFAAKGNFGGKRVLMPLEVGIRSIDFLVENSGSRHNLEVDFFGGEPLMNFDVVRKIVEYSRGIQKKYSKNFRFTITTNGLLLDDEKIDFINQEMCNVVLSLDGRKSVNDNLRLLPSRQGCYERILPLFKKLLKTRPANKNYYVRGTFTKHNLDFSNDVLHLSDLGFKHISIEPVVCNSDLPYCIEESDIDKIKSEYERLFNIMLKRSENGSDFSFFHFFIDLDASPCAIKRMRGCGCGNEYLAITPEGDIYPCHQFVGKFEWMMGNILQKTFNKNIRETFSQINVSSKDDCRDCFAKFYCSGGCSANNWNYNQNLSKPYKVSCELQKKRLECALALQSIKKISKCDSIDRLVNICKKGT
ncbi:MAG: thioether cross-link-forming SCIFF peptide maturase [Oscillospiraceae bacterium]|jgi:uncharacterized protein|nr:thioether cross-link-forming SCIFF peptide maturase [Oscillospiraceae bacterium]